MTKPPNIPDYPEAIFAVELQEAEPNQIFLIWRAGGHKQSLYAKKMLFKFRMPKAANEG